MNPFFFSTVQKKACIYGYCLPGRGNLKVLHKGMKVEETARRQRWADVQAGGRGVEGDADHLVAPQQPLVVIFVGVHCPPHPRHKVLTIRIIAEKEMWPGSHRGWICVLNKSESSS